MQAFACIFCRIMLLCEKKDRGAIFKSTGTLNYGRNNRERKCRRSVHFCRKMYAGLVQNMYQTVTKKWSAIITFPI